MENYLLDSIRSTPRVPWVDRNARPKATVAVTSGEL